MLNQKEKQKNNPFQKKQKNNRSKTNKEKKERKKSLEKLEKAKSKKKKYRPIISITIGLKEKKDYFIENLAMLLHSSMSIGNALAALKKDLGRGRMLKIIDFIEKNVNRGLTLSESIKKTGIFSDYVVSLTKIGEESGHLSKNLTVISKQQKKEREFNAKIKTAIMSPAFVMSLTIIIGIGVAWFVLPNLTTVFSQLKVDLPLITRIIIGIGQFMKDYGAFAVPAFVVILGFSLFMFFINPKTKFIGQAMALKVPGIKDLIIESELARMGFILGTLLGAGIPIVTSLKSLSNTTTTYKYKDLFNHIAEKVKEGNSFKRSLNTYKKSRKLIPIPVQQMIIASEKSGKLAETFIAIGEVNEAKNENSTKRLSTMLEPILLFIIWGGVVFVALGVIVPIYSLVGGFEKGTSSTPNTSSGPPEKTQQEAEKQEENPAQKEPKEGLNDQAPQQETEDSQEEAVNDSQENNGENKNILVTSDEIEVNIRRDPAINGEFIRKSELGEEFEFSIVQGDWYKIKLSPERQAWINANYITVIQEAPFEENNLQAPNINTPEDEIE